MSTTGSEPRLKKSVSNFVDRLSLKPDEFDKLKTSPKKIAETHIRFYKYYIKFASKCDALLFDGRSQNYLESCIHFLESKPITKKVLLQSKSNIMKILDSLNDLSNILEADKQLMAKVREVYEISDFDLPDKEAPSIEPGGALDLLKHLKNLLDDPIETPESNSKISEANSSKNIDTRADSMRTGHLSPDSDRSSSPILQENEENERAHKVELMTEYFLSDGGFDSVYGTYEIKCADTAFKAKMNELTAKAQSISENKYSGVDNMMAKMKINVPILNYSIDRLDSIDSNNVIENNEIFEGNKAVINAVLHNDPDFLIVGPFEIYCRNKVYVYHCLVNQCNECLTTSIEFLKMHVKHNHCECDAVDWACTKCDILHLHSSSQKSLDGALEHLAKYHSSRSTYYLARERLSEMNRLLATSLALCPENAISSDFESDLFHCDVSGCQFSTNSPMIAFCHYSPRADGSQIKKCEYCPFATFSTHHYCGHVFNAHGFTKYKCGFCSYRTVSKANAISHQKDAHAENEHKIFGFEPLENTNYNFNCLGHNQLKPFVCEHCNFGTMIEQKFRSHLQGHSHLLIKCHYCSCFSSDDIGELCDHLLTHGIGQYHCLYCQEAFDVASAMQRHLHQTHPTQYPYKIVLQDFELCHRRLKDRYRKVQKLEIGDESVIVVSLDSNYDVKSVPIINCSKVVIIDDVDLCKAQLKYFLKNTYKEVLENLEVPRERSPSPTVMDTLDITVDEERADIKPRIRLKALHLLMNQDSAGEENGNNSNQLNSGSPSTQNESRPLLTPAQIKSERMESFSETVHTDSCATDDILPLNEEVEENETPASDEHIDIDIGPNQNFKRENVVDLGANCVTEPVRVKCEALDSLREVQATDSNCLVIHSARTLQDGELMEALPHLLDDNSSTSTAAENITAADEAPLLSGSSIANMPVDFDCQSVSSSRVRRSSGSSLSSDEVLVVDVEERTETQPAVSTATPPAPQVPAIASKGTGSLSASLAIEPGVSPELVLHSPTKAVIEASAPLSSSSKSQTIELGQVVSSGRVAQSSIRAKQGGSIQIPSTSSSIIRIGKTVSLPGSGRAVVLNRLNLSPSSNSRFIPVKSRPPVAKVVSFRCNICNFKSTDRNNVVAHLQETHMKLSRANAANANVASTSQSGAHLAPRSIPTNGVGCPYCSGQKFKGIRSYETHHVQEHGDYSEVKCFIDYPSDVKPVPDKVFACNFCDAFFANESMLWVHSRSIHQAKLAALPKPIRLRAIIGLKKLVCPVYNCMEEFFQVSKYKEHFFASHQRIVSCKRCTYNADNAEDFQAFHDNMDPDEAVNHFSYFRNEAQKAELLHSKRFKDPLYCLIYTMLDSVPQKLSALKTPATLPIGQVKP